MVTCPVDEGKAGDVVFPDFNKAFYTIPHSFLPDKLSNYGILNLEWAVSLCTGWSSGWRAKLKGL